MTIEGNIIDIKARDIYPALLTIKAGKIEHIQRVEKQGKQLPYLLPGFIDAHVHIESSMLVPTEFARMAVVHGTVATVSDPHEIGNVLGVEGVEFMIENGNQSSFKFFFGAPSCVPATTFETAGASITVEDVDYLLKKPEIKYLAEMMNWPGVLFKDKEVFAKIDLAKQMGKPIDGHAPGLKGQQATEYIQAGMSTDHECFTLEEAKHKLEQGMKVLIREGSAAKNFEALIELLPRYPDEIMFCSDDKHPDSLVEGHINQLVKRALAKGCNLFDVLQVACVNPVEHYDLEVGQLKVGDDADFIIINNLEDFYITDTYINGQLVAQKGTSFLTNIASEHPNNFHALPTTTDQFKQPNASATIPVIEVIDGELITNRLDISPTIIDGYNESDITRDILKITVVNRYTSDATPAIAFIKNFGLKEGAIASSVGHDSHNIICVGVDDASIAKAVNLVIKAKGGLAAVSSSTEQVLGLPIAGLMTDEDGYQVSENYLKLDGMVKEMGCQLQAPFMSLSFMALLVIPSLKLSDLGLFDGSAFEFVT